MLHGHLNVKFVSAVNTYRPILHLLLLNTYSEEVTGEKLHTEVLRHVII